MHFNLSSVVALLLLLLAGNVFASNTCYKGGKKFSEIGNNDEVNLALTDLCQQLAGSYPLHTQNQNCQNANGHAIHGTILVTEGPFGKLGAEVSQEACVDLLTQVKDKCSHGGDLGQLRSHPENYGSDWFKANVILDPDSGGC